MDYLKDTGALMNILKKGAEHARQRAGKTLKAVQEAVGFLACAVFISMALAGMALFNGCSSVPATPQASLEMPPTKGPVGRTFEENADKFTMCGRDSVSIQTGNTQKITFRFTVRPDGSVAHARVESMSSPDPDLQVCTLRALAPLKFPKPKDKTAKDIRYSITVKPD